MAKIVNSFAFDGRKKQRKRLRLPLLLLPAIFLLFSFGIHYFLLAKVSALARIAGKNEIERLLSETVQKSFLKGEYGYTDLITLHYTTEGNVSAMTTEMAVCNRLCAETLLSLLDSLREVDEIQADLPLGNLTGLSLLSGKGPACHVIFVHKGGASVHLESRFTKMGINQTRHEILMVLETESLLLMPGHEETVKNEIRYPLTDTVILGRVPDAYTEIHRLTDDITENEIDDIYDFGAG